MMTCKVILLGKLLDAETASAEATVRPASAVSRPSTGRAQAQPLAPAAPQACAKDKQMPDAFEFRSKVQGDLPRELVAIVAQATGSQAVSGASNG